MMGVYEVDAAVTILVEADTPAEAMEQAGGRPLREWSGPHMTESQVHHREDVDDNEARPGGS